MKRSIPALESHKSSSKWQPNLSRRLDINNFNHKLLLVICLVSIVIFLGLGRGVLGVVHYFLTPFLGWALTRELDPKHPDSAILTAIVWIGLMYFLFGTNLILSAVILFIIRGISGITGKKLNFWDWLILIYSSWYLISSLSFRRWLFDGFYWQIVIIGLVWMAVVFKSNIKIKPDFGQHFLSKYRWLLSAGFFLVVTIWTTFTPEAASVWYLGGVLVSILMSHIFRWCGGRDLD